MKLSPVFVAVLAAALVSGCATTGHALGRIGGVRLRCRGPRPDCFGTGSVEFGQVALRQVGVVHAGGVRFPQLAESGGKVLFVCWRVTPSADSCGIQGCAEFITSIIRT